MKRILLLNFFLFTGLVLLAQAEDAITEGNQFYRNAQFAQAEARYREALEKEPGNAVAQMNLANALYKQRKMDEAIQIYNNVAATDKTTKTKSAAFYNQGAILSRQKELDKSIEAYKSALRLDPDDKQ